MAESGSFDYISSMPPDDRLLSFTLYKFISTHLMYTTSLDDVRLYLILTWNLMSTSDVAATLRYEQLSWETDALGITLRNGPSVDNIRHVYANPIVPEICPILALAIHFATHRFVAEDDHLFFGGAEYHNRFQTTLRRILSAWNIANELAQYNVTPDQVALSRTIMQNGALRYSASISDIACPSEFALAIRASRSLGDFAHLVEYFAAGDQFAARAVCGLPADTPEFTTLPPHFLSRDWAVGMSIRACFPYAPESLHGVLELCLASLVYHAPYLRRSLLPDHPLFSTPLFRDDAFLPQLTKLVVCTDVNMMATGIPGHLRKHIAKSAPPPPGTEDSFVLKRVMTSVVSTVGSWLSPRKAAQSATEVTPTRTPTSQAQQNSRGLPPSSLAPLYESTPGTVSSPTVSVSSPSSYVSHVVPPPTSPNSRSSAKRKKSTGTATSLGSPGASPPALAKHAASTISASSAKSLAAQAASQVQILLAQPIQVPLSPSHGVPYPPLARGSANTPIAKRASPISSPFRNTSTNDVAQPAAKRAKTIRSTNDTVRPAAQPTTMQPAKTVRSPAQAAVQPATTPVNTAISTDDTAQPAAKRAKTVSRKPVPFTTEEKQILGRAVTRHQKGKEIDWDLVMRDCRTKLNGRSLLSLKNKWHSRKKWWWEAKK